MSLSHPPARRFAFARGLPFPRRRHFVQGHPIIRNFFADRCTHLAAIVAYYALLSLLPLMFLALSLTGLFGRPDEGSELIKELERILPGQSVDSLEKLAQSLQSNAAQLSAIGAVGLVWGSLGFLSALESALNLIYDVPNRPFVRQKLFIFGLVGGGLISVFVSLMVATTAHAIVSRHAPGLFELDTWSFVAALFVSTAITFAFLLVVYRWLPNTRIGTREVLPGTIYATVLMQASFQVLPLYLRFSETIPVLRAFGGAVLLLVWLFLMGNILLLGAEVNWWVGRGRELARRGEAPEEIVGHA